MNKLVKLSIAVLLAGALIAWYRPNVLYNPVAFHNAVAKVPFLQSFFKYFHGSKAAAPSSSSSSSSSAKMGPEPEPAGAKKKMPNRVFTREELAKYKGEDDSDIYLAIMGNVFDVTRGRDYYGPGGGYAFFSGTDGSRAFVTGKFDPEGLTDDISGLEQQDYIGLRDWLDFYEKGYTPLGKLQGLYYDSNGKPTEYYHKAQEWIKAASEYKDEEDQFKEKYPMCNIDYKPDTGSRVWCSDASGGVKRDWIGVPRSLYSADSKDIRCACVQESDLEDPLLREYPGCPKDAVSCKLP